MRIDRHLLFHMLGYRAGLLHGDTLVWDRWRWLCRRLPRTANGERLLDVGCGSGAFTIAASLRGYEALGMSWSKADLDAAAARADLSGAKRAKFLVWDARLLHEQKPWKGHFDVVLCLEAVEHILDDAALFRSMAACLVPGGRLLLTTPNFLYRAISREDDGPFQREELGWHVRRGYTPTMLRELCREAGLWVEEISYCSGWCSQKVTALMRKVGSLHPWLGWGVALPFRPAIALCDPWISSLLHWPLFSIGLVAYKPRYPTPGSPPPPGLPEDGAAAPSDAA
ncbi:bifunctional 2-polyprenyl-6-hydroxyphenol methylase/3-demethylubiquinol 3-O-methyltransferase UbiG [Methylacidimicrobium sp. B4]|uniref:class I SAM-dependent methyltransferase n=1 Tax=Methylacidimicrobium sp. B4 TaxID=2796139 RepID=UPI001A8E0005|nr:class I SAM-dependent methyltransferase [Methylacidimicrobium sp. B4]QSR85448.1 class I SAM-dependent methyltransferase [Methylacidimicrobium sp. B4]